MSTINLTAQAKGTGANSWTVSGTGVFSGVNFSGGIDGTTSDTATALEVAINARATLNNSILATAIGSVVGLEAKVPGADGNLWELSKIDIDTSNFTLSGDFLAGGVNPLSSLFGFNIVPEVIPFPSDVAPALLSLKNNGTEYLNIKREIDPSGTGWYTDVAVINLSSVAGTPVGKILLDDTFNDALTIWPNNGLLIRSGSDINTRGELSFRPGYFSLYPRFGDFMRLEFLYGGTSSSQAELGFTNRGLRVAGPAADPLYSVAIPGDTFNTHCILASAEYGTLFIGDAGQLMGPHTGGSGMYEWKFISTAFPTNNPVYSAFVLDTRNNFSGTNDKLFRLKNFGTEKLTIDKSGNTDFVGELSIKVYSQASQPTLTANNRIAMWIDTDDSNRVYMVFRRGSGDHVKVELT